MSGYRRALKEIIKYIKEHLTVKIDNMGNDSQETSLINAAKTSMSSKIIGAESNFFAEMAVKAMQSVKMTNVMGETKYPVKNINILKVHGKSSKESILVNGYALEASRASQ